MPLPEPFFRRRPKGSGRPAGNGLFSTAVQFSTIVLHDRSPGPFPMRQPGRAVPLFGNRSDRRLQSGRRILITRTFTRQSVTAGAWARSAALPVLPKPCRNGPKPCRPPCCVVRTAHRRYGHCPAPVRRPGNAGGPAGTPQGRGFPLHGGVNAFCAAMPARFPSGPPSNPEEGAGLTGASYSWNARTPHPAAPARRDRANFPRSTRRSPRSGSRLP